MNAPLPKVILFTSPKAGSGAGRDQLPRLREQLTRAGFPFFETATADELKTLVCSDLESSPSPIVVTAGGDGTLSLAASLLPSSVPLCPMPMGTENLLARLIGQSNRAEDVVQTLRSGFRCAIDAGEANGRLFLIMATIGFDAEVVRAVHLRRQGHISRLAYALPAARLFGRYTYPSLKIQTYDSAGQETTLVDAGWAMLFNLPCYAAGLRIQPKTDADDGKLDAVFLTRKGRIAALRYLTAIGIQRHQQLADVQQDLVHSVRVDCDQRIAYQLDGDYVGKTPVEIKTLRKRVTILFPPDAGDRVFDSIGVTKRASQ
ncbi:MAG: diacylglycerol kinase family protein [Planctomycetota bacterium]